MTITRRKILLGAALAPALSHRAASAAAPPASSAPSAAFVSIKSRQAAWLRTAEALKPVLRKTVQTPLALVTAVPDSALVLRFRMEREADAAMLASRLLKKGDSFILDFGGHRTGHFEFELVGEGSGVDAPVRLRLTFGEAPPDVAEPLHPSAGTMSTSWLPDEIINVDFLPQKVRMPRRYAFRYVKVEVLDTSPTFGVRFRQVRAVALTSAGRPPAPLNSGDALLDRIDQVGLATLRDCMQTVYEDGPRRDQRLWIGDTRLQALAAYASFGGEKLVKRCLYLFAAFPREQDCLVAGCVYEKPAPNYGGIVIFDYAALFNATLYDYVKQTGDKAAGLDLWPVALRQVELLSAHLDPSGMFVDPKDIWLFIDWAKELDRTTSVQGVLIYAFERTLWLARLIGRERDVAQLPARIQQMRAAAHARCFDGERGVFVSGEARQVSWASQAWMAIAGVPQTPEQGRQAIVRAMAQADATRPTTPYLYHHIVEGMLSCGMRDEALALIKRYWGGMVAAGADTFWEIYEPDKPLSSPYGDIHLNSYCHAWSCTPSYFLRARGLADVKPS
jgi:hypothetical protein